MYEKKNKIVKENLKEKICIELNVIISFVVVNDLPSINS
jgi:hypothetical protein